MKSNSKIIVLSTDNPNSFDVKVKTTKQLSIFSVKAKDRKQALERYTNPSFSKCTMSLSYNF